MTTPKISPFNSLASEYDSWFDSKGKLIFAIELQALKQILPLLSKPWLEIGVGSGRFAQNLGIQNGLDPSIEILRLAKDRAVNVFRGKGEAVPFKDNTFGAVFLIHTLCFVDTPLEVLTEASRILSSGGHIVLCSMLQESPWGKFNKLKMEKAHRFYKHATFHSRMEIDAYLIRACFSIEQIVSTLFQQPNKVEHMEIPQPGFFDNAGFTVIMARKG